MFFVCLKNCAPPRPWQRTGGRRTQGSLPSKLGDMAPFNVRKSLPRQERISSQQCKTLTAGGEGKSKWCQPALEGSTGMVLLVSKHSTALKGDESGWVQRDPAHFASEELNLLKLPVR